ncbi:MAG: transporter substrate-binding domain-containing protein [Clostridiales bacterium]|nr:transporter substrate-binding domain-containing protein [Clostridiales bacterium]
MKLHKLTALAIAGLMMFGMTGCGSSQTAATTAAETTAAAETEAAQTESEASETEAETASAETEAASGERLQLRVGMECAYAPNNWQETAATETNVPIENVPGAYAEGYDVQFARIIADGLDRDLVIVKLSWDGLIDALNQGQIDAIIAGMMDTPERKEAINFSDPYHETIYSMMVNEDSPYADATSIQDFSGAAVLGQKDTALDTVIDQIEGVNHLTPVSSVPDMLGRLQQGTCDALVINLENSAGYLASNPKFKVIVFEEGKGFTLESKGGCVGLRKSDTELLEQVNEILATVDKETRDEMWETAVENQPQ